MNDFLVDPKLNVSRLLTFQLGDEQLAFDQAEVREVLLLPTLVQVPEQPAVVRGFCRGADRIWPVLCLAGILGLERGTLTAESALIFPRNGAGSNESDFALLVDGINGSLLAPDGLEDAPSLYSWNALCKGLALVNGKEIPVLDLSTLIHEEERLRFICWSLREMARLDAWPETTNTLP